jgi:hypothetical protein
VIDIETMKIVDTISTGGQLRANEMTYDPLDRIVTVGNQNDKPPFTTFISTGPGHKIIGKVITAEATRARSSPSTIPRMVSCITRSQCSTRIRPRVGLPYLIPGKRHS